MRRRTNAPRRRVDVRTVLFWVLAPVIFVLGTAGLMIIVNVGGVPAALSALVGLGWGAAAGIAALIIYGLGVAR